MTAASSATSSRPGRRGGGRGGRPRLALRRGTPAALLPGARRPPAMRWEEGSDAAGRRVVCRWRDITQRPPSLRRSRRSRPCAAGGGRSPTSVRGSGACSSGATPRWSWCRRRARAGGHTARTSPTGMWGRRLVALLPAWTSGRLLTKSAAYHRRRRRFAPCAVAAAAGPASSSRRLTSSFWLFSRNRGEESDPWSQCSSRCSLASSAGPPGHSVGSTAAQNQAGRSVGTQHERQPLTRDARAPERAEPPAERQKRRRQAVGRIARCPRLRGTTR